ncbi:MAG: hypothetical protein IJU50_03325, partial [Lachnospiraceae bacterium]|nr:hypothetical protein [Lachnospiraceae bacterium]
MREFAKNNKRFLLVELFLLLACLFLEGVVFQYEYFSTKNLEPVEIGEEYIPLYINGNSYDTTEIALESVNVQAFFAGEADGLVHVKVAILDDSSKYDDSWADEGYVCPKSEKYSARVFRIKSNGSLRRLLITWDSDMLLKKLVFNVTIPYQFRIFRFLLLFVLFSFGASVFFFRLWEIQWNPENQAQKLAYISLCVLCCLTVFASYKLLSPSAEGRVDYRVRSVPFPVENREQFIKLSHVLMTDAFLKGKIAIDENVTALNGLENIYDDSERAKAGLANFWEDYAYFDGNVYSYFGPAPVLVFYLPFYFLFHMAPSYLQAGTFFSLWTV